jgi:hypothetical protein
MVPKLKQDSKNELAEILGFVTSSDCFDEDTDKSNPTDQSSSSEYIADLPSATITTRTPAKVEKL